jgi:hypothetical protein
VDYENVNFRQPLCSGTGYFEFNLKNMQRLLFFMLFLLRVKPVPAQTNGTQRPCRSPESSQFDFWVGDWELTWNDTSKGINSVKRVLDGCGIQENFSDPVNNFNGMSWSIYNPGTANWQQTWIDNQGGYIVLTGKFDKEEMILATKPVANTQGKMTISRMVFYNIKAGSFDWNWENSIDNGRTWKLNWKIHYKRKK